MVGTSCGRYRVDALRGAPDRRAYQLRGSARPAPARALRSRSRLGRRRAVRCLRCPAAWAAEQIARLEAADVLVEISDQRLPLPARTAVRTRRGRDRARLPARPCRGDTGDLRSSSDLRADRWRVCPDVRGPTVVGRLTSDPLGSEQREHTPCPWIYEKPRLPDLPARARARPDCTRAGQRDRSGAQADAASRVRGLGPVQPLGRIGLPAQHGPRRDRARSARARGGEAVRRRRGARLARSARGGRVRLPRLL